MLFRFFAPFRLSNRVTCPSTLTSTRSYLTFRQKQPKICKSADEAVLAIKDNDLVFVHGISAVPTKFLGGEWAGEKHCYCRC